MEKVLKTKKECYITVRNDMIDMFVKEFDIDEFNVIEI